MESNGGTIFRLEFLLGMAAFLLGATFAWTRRPRLTLPAWTGFVEKRISAEMSSIEGSLQGHSVQAAVIYARERSFSKLRIDVGALLQPRWRFSANLRTGKVWTHAGEKSLAILCGSSPAIRADLYLEIREGTAELDLPFRDPREIYATVLEVLGLVRRLSEAVPAEALSREFHAASTLSEIERNLMLL